MSDIQGLGTARSVSLIICAVMFAMAFTGILLAHWSHRRRANDHFHTTTLIEMSWSVAPMLMVVAVLASTFKIFWQA